MSLLLVDAPATVALATVVSSVVTGVVMYLTKRSGDHASVTIAETTTRGQIEEEAFERAKSYLDDVIDRQATEIRDQAAEIRDLKGRVGTCENRLSTTQRDAMRTRQVARRLARAVYELRRALGDKAPVDPQLDEAVMDILGEET